MLYSLILIWFSWVRDWGYWGIFVLMALESTIVPIPSEVVMPPAAYWASQGHLSFWGVVLVGTLGSYVGSSATYFLFKKFGRLMLSLIHKYVSFEEDKIRSAENFVIEHGVFGVFVSRLFPVIRHLVSMPAGLLNMNFAKFSAMTIAGAGLWNFILAWWGEKVIGAHPELLNSPKDMMAAVKTELHSFVLGIAILILLYATTVVYKNRQKKQRQPSQ